MIVKGNKVKVTLESGEVYEGIFCVDKGNKIIIKTEDNLEVMFPLDTIRIIKELKQVNLSN